MSVLTKYKNLISVAHWEKDITDVSFIHEYPINYLAIIFGYNSGTREEHADYSQFHSNKTRFDARLSKAITGTKYEGCLITDLFDIEDSDMNRVKANLLQSDRDEAFSRITEMIEEINPKQLIALGNEVYVELKKMFPHIEIIKIPHHCAWLLKDVDYVNNVKTILAK